MKTRGSLIGALIFYLFIWLFMLALGNPILFLATTAGLFILIVQVFRKERKPKSCAFCGEEFKANDPKTAFCSRLCGYAYRSSHKEGAGA